MKRSFPGVASWVLSLIIPLYISFWVGFPDGMCYGTLLLLWSCALSLEFLSDPVWCHWVGLHFKESRAYTKAGQRVSKQHIACAFTRTNNCQACLLHPTYLSCTVRFNSLERRLFKQKLTVRILTAEDSFGHSEYFPPFLYKWKTSQQRTGRLLSHIPAHIMHSNSQTEKIDTWQTATGGRT